MKINILERVIGSGFFSGYLPFAPGTFGSLVALGIFLIPGFSNPSIMIPAIIILTIIGIPIGTKFEKVYGKDPKQCTVDEVVGTWITFLFVPKNIWFIVIGFVIWRVADILKPYPANKFEEFEGGVGIMLDDIVAGLYSLTIVHVIIKFFNYIQIL